MDNLQAVTPINNNDYQLLSDPEYGVLDSMLESDESEFGVENKPKTNISVQGITLKRLV
jgi:hypothetical protein